MADLDLPYQIPSRVLRRYFLFNHRIVLLMFNFDFCFSHWLPLMHSIYFHNELTFYLRYSGAM